MWQDHVRRDKFLASGLTRMVQFELSWSQPGWGQESAWIGERLKVALLYSYWWNSISSLFSSSCQCTFKRRYWTPRCPNTVCHLLWVQGSQLTGDVP